MSCVNERLMRALWTLRSLNGPIINTALICCWTPVKGFSKWGWIQAVWGKAEAKWALISTGPERCISEFIPTTETGSWDSYAFVFATALMLFHIIRLRVFWARGKRGQWIFSRCSAGLLFDRCSSVTPQSSHFLGGFPTAYKNHLLHGTNIFMNNGVWGNETQVERCVRKRRPKLDNKSQPSFNVCNKC